MLTHNITLDNITSSYILANAVAKIENYLQHLWSIQNDK